MAAGTLVFPAIMGAFILLVAGLVVSTPATPPSENASARLQKIRPGDVALLEVTGYYDGKKVFYSTQEERAAEFQFGPIAPNLVPDPVEFETVPPPDEPDALTRALSGHRVGDRFSTGLIPPQQAFGDWAGERTVNRTLGALPLEVRYTNQSYFASTGRAFDADEYAQAWKDRGYDLAVGTVFPCEDTDLWACRVTVFDRAGDVFTYRREVREGDRFPFRALLGGIDAAGDLDWNMTALLHPNGQSFQLRLDPPVGSVFQFRTSLSGPFQQGTYEILALFPSTIQARYSPAAEAEPRLVGKSVSYDIVVVRIIRPAA